MLGPRIGKFDKNGRPKVIGGHSMPLASFGWEQTIWYGRLLISEYLLTLDVAVPARVNHLSLHNSGYRC